MKYALIDTATGHVKQWQDHTQFGYADPAVGEQLVALADDYAFPSAPQWYVNGAFVDSDPAQTPAALLAQAQAAQIGAMTQAYAAAISQDVSFTTAGGVSKTYQADAGSQDVLVKTLQRCLAAGAVPSGFYWVAKDNTPVPFTLADLDGLDAAMFSQGWAAFQRLQDRKAAINAADSVSAAQAVAW